MNRKGGIKPIVKILVISIILIFFSSFTSLWAMLIEGAGGNLDLDKSNITQSGLTFGNIPDSGTTPSVFDTPTEAIKKFVENLHPDWECLEINRIGAYYDPKEKLHHEVYYNDGLIEDYIFDLVEIDETHAIGQFREKKVYQFIPDDDIGQEGSWVEVKSEDSVTIQSLAKDSSEVTLTESQKESILNAIGKDFGEDVGNNITEDINKGNYIITENDNGTVTVEVNGENIIYKATLSETGSLNSHILIQTNLSQNDLPEGIPDEWGIDLTSPEIAKEILKIYIEGECIAITKYKWEENGHQHVLTEYNKDRLQYIINGYLLRGVKVEDKILNIEYSKDYYHEESVTLKEGEKVTELESNGFGKFVTKDGSQKLNLDTLSLERVDLVNPEGSRPIAEEKSAMGQTSSEINGVDNKEEINPDEHILESDEFLLLDINGIQLRFCSLDNHGYTTQHIILPNADLRRYLYSQDYYLADGEGLKSSIEDWLEGNSELLEDLGISDLDEVTPSQAAILAVRFTEEKLNYNFSEAVEGGSIFATNKVRSVSEIIDSGGGICFDYAQVTSAVFDVLKDLYPKNLENSYMKVTKTPLGSSEEEWHAWGTLYTILNEENIVVSQLDSLWSDDGGSLDYSLFRSGNLCWFLFEKGLISYEEASRGIAAFRKAYPNSVSGYRFAIDIITGEQSSDVFRPVMRLLDLNQGVPDSLLAWYFRGISIALGRYEDYIKFRKFSSQEMLEHERENINQLLQGIGSVRNRSSGIDSFNIQSRWKSVEEDVRSIQHWFSKKEVEDIDYRDYRSNVAVSEFLQQYGKAIVVIEDELGRDIFKYTEGEILIVKDGRLKDEKTRGFLAETFAESIYASIIENYPPEIKEDFEKEHTDWALKLGLASYIENKFKIQYYDTTLNSYSLMWSVDKAIENWMQELDMYIDGYYRLHSKD